MSPNKRTEQRKIKHWCVWLLENKQLQQLHRTSGHSMPPGHYDVPITVMSLCVSFFFSYWMICRNRLLIPSCACLCAFLSGKKQSFQQAWCRAAVTPDSFRLIPALVCCKTECRARVWLSFAEPVYGNARKSRGWKHAHQTRVRMPCLLLSCQVLQSRLSDCMQKANKLR